MSLADWVKLRININKANQLVKNAEKARVVASCLFIVTPSVADHMKLIRETTTTETPVDLKYCLTEKFYGAAETTLKTAYKTVNDLIAIALMNTMSLKDLQYAYKICTSKKWQPIQKAFNTTASSVGIHKTVIAAAFLEVNQSYAELIRNAELSRGCDYKNYILPIE